MAVISISIEESEQQVLAGIPRQIFLETNIVATIFYTLDGTEPNLYSNIYTNSIILPTDQFVVTLKAYATNGVDNSDVITEVYQSNLVNENIRLPHSSVNYPPGTTLQELYPFGDNVVPSDGQYLNPADSGVTVDNPALPAVSSGFLADGYPGGFTNNQYNLLNYNIVYATGDRLNQTGPNIGNLPANVTINIPAIPPEESEQFSNLFDPRALVIYQDFSKEDPTDPPTINRQYFSLQNDITYRDGANFFISGQDSPGISGSFVKSYFNPRTNMMNFYYFDSSVNRWIISTVPYTPNVSVDSTLSDMVFYKEKGAGFVFEWIPFQRRVLF